MRKTRISNRRLLEEIHDVMLRVIRLETDVRNRYEKIVARIGAQELELAALQSNKSREPAPTVGFNFDLGPKRAVGYENEPLDVRAEPAPADGASAGPAASPARA